MEKVGDDDDGDDYDDAVIVVPFDGHQVVDVHQAPPLLAYTQNSRGTVQAHYDQSSRGTHYYYVSHNLKSLHCTATGWTASGAGGRRSDVW